MTELGGIVQRNTRILRVLLFSSALLAVITPNGRFFLSLAVGIFLGLVNLRMLALFVHNIINRLSQGQRVSMLGASFRVTLILVSFITIWLFPDLFSITVVAIGVVTSYFVIIIDYGWSLFIKKM